MTSAAPRVAIVDDDVLVLRALDRLLRAAGLAVETFSSADEFLQSRRPAAGCVVMDLSMPGRGGLELQRALAEAADSRPIVFISGQGTVPASVQAMKAGAVDFLTKPIDEPRLLDAVRAALEKDRVLREQDAARAAITSRLLTLTERERQVLAHVVVGN